MVLKIVVISAVLSCFGMFAHAAYSVCNETQVGSIVSVTIKGCEDKPGCDKPKPCELKRGTNATLNFMFGSNVASTNLTAVALAHFSFADIRLSIPNDACKSSGVACPIKAGQTYSYTTTVPIKSTYPKFAVNIKWFLKSNKGEDIVCANIPAEIVD